MADLRVEFAARHRRLLQLERDAEIAENERLLRTRSDAELVARGATLLRLEVADLEPGFGGRLHAVLRPSRGGDLPAHRFGPGDVVAARKDRDDPATGAVVVRARRDHLVIALDGDDDLPPVVRLDKVATDVTFRRLDAALAQLARDAKGDRARFLDVMFGEREQPEAAPAPIASWFDPGLDDSQRRAVALALAAPMVARIHGPPGTGKTTALVEFCRQAVAAGERLLACAPSNVAVDNLAERLTAAGVKVVRLGHPARVQAAVRDVSLAQLVADSPDQKVLRDNRREFDQTVRGLQRAKNRQDRAAAKDALRQLRSERRQLERAITRGIIDGADVVLATTTGASEAAIGERAFDRVVIDEAAQALEAACWIPMQHADRVVLAGDHHQLPPTILSDEAARQGLAHTLFERLERQPTTAASSSMLTVQYRMHAKIMSWSSRTFYGDALRAAAAVAARRLVDLEGITTTQWTDEPLCFVDTAGCGHEETAEGDEESKHNPGEAELVARIVGELLEAGVAPSDLAVITPYNAQVQRLRERLPHDGLEIGTVDGLQGREKEAVVVSLVRSN
ncbi:MAG: AAA family ATPase, partial [Planctomycetes bacterium]|nr:AAA family ATPase [Planctomycetota bacterium]